MVVVVKRRMSHLQEWRLAQRKASSRCMIGVIITMGARNQNGAESGVMPGCKH
jgi:hypothetical protein